MKRLMVLLVGFFMLPLGSLFAADGATPIWEPTVINEPGKYVVTRNLESDGVVIHVNTSDVEIDLNGFRLTGSTEVPAILCVTVSNVKIHGGTVSIGNPGIYAELSSSLTLEDISILDSTGAGIVLIESADYIVRRCTIRATGLAISATAAYGTPGIIEGNWITGGGGQVPGSDTILIQGGSGSTVRDNKLAHFVHGHGIRVVSCDYCEISGNMIDDYGADVLSSGVTVESSSNVRVTGNATSEAIKLVISSAAMVTENRARLIRIDADSHSNTILRNGVEYASGSSGVHVDGDRNRIEDNTLNDKPGFGLYFSPTSENNVYLGNVAKGNYGSSGCTGTGTTDFCDEGTNNTSHGDNYMPGKM